MSRAPRRAGAPGTSAARGLERAGVRHGRGVVVAEPSQQVGAGRVEVVVAVELARERVDAGQTARDVACHRDGDGAVQLRHRVALERGEPVVERREPLPASGGRRRRVRVLDGDRRLQDVATRRTGAQGACRQVRRSRDRRGVPAGALLVGEQDELACACTSLRLRPRWLWGRASLWTRRSGWSWPRCRADERQRLAGWVGRLDFRPRRRSLGGGVIT